MSSKITNEPCTCDGAVAKANRYANAYISAQIVLGGQTTATLRPMLVAARRNQLPVTLLAPKFVGRGVGWHPYPYGDWLNVVIDLSKQQDQCPTISIDTPLAAYSDAALRLAGVPEWLYEVQEGRFSMYLDAVDCKLGPSSYEPGNMKPWPKSFTARAVKRAFAGFRGGPA